MVVALLLAGCSLGSSSAKAALAPLEVPSPLPPPPPVVEPVVGTIDVITDDSSWNEQLGLANDGEPKDGSVETATQAVAAKLDRFLNGAQVGQPELIELRGVWLQAADPAAAEVLERGLTNPDNPVREANYVMRVHLEPNPTLVATSVQVRRHDETSVKVEMLFDVSGDRPVLHVVGGAEAQ